MQLFKQLICPVSGLRTDEHQVRITALLIVFSMGAFLISGNALIPAAIAIDFLIRGFTRLRYSPLSWISAKVVYFLKLRPVLIDRGSKIFAARIGFMLTFLTALFSLYGLHTASVVSGSVLVTFAFLECGLNFCAGCWIYSHIVYPLVRNKE